MVRRGDRRPRGQLKGANSLPASGAEDFSFVQAHSQIMLANTLHIHTHHTTHPRTHPGAIGTYA